MTIIIEFLSVFPKYGDQQTSHNNLDLLEPDRRKKIKCLVGMLAWCAKLMNRLIKPDSIQDMKKVDECYQMIILKLLPSELVDNKMGEASSPRVQTSFEEQVAYLID